MPDPSRAESQADIHDAWGNVAAGELGEANCRSLWRLGSL
jgi:hypothetical protein